MKLSKEMQAESLKTLFWYGRAIAESEERLRMKYTLEEGEKRHLENCIRKAQVCFENLWESLGLDGVCPNVRIL